MGWGTADTDKEDFRGWQLNRVMAKIFYGEEEEASL